MGVPRRPVLLALACLSLVQSGCDYEAILGEYTPLVVPSASPAVSSGSSDAGVVRGGVSPTANVVSPPVLRFDGGLRPAPRADAGGVCADGAIVCESFDTHVADYEVRLRYGELGVVEEPSFAGGGALRIYAEGPRALSRLVFPVEPPLLQDKLFVRFNMYMPETSTVDYWVVVFEWPRAPEGKVSFDLFEDRFQIHLSNSGVDQGGSIPRDQWFCVNLEAELADTGEVVVWVDGDEVLRQRGVTLPEQGLSELFLSAVTSAAQVGPVVYFVDEFVAATEELRCP